MTRTRAVALLAPLLLCLCAAEPQDFTSPDGKFTARFPAEPKEMEQKTAAGPMKMYFAPQGTTVYMVMDLDLPALANATPEQAEMGLEKAREQIAGPKGKIVDEKKMKLDNKYPGREWHIDQGKTHMRIRMYVVETHMYSAAVVGQTEDAVKAKEATAFLDSFALKKK